MLLAIALGLVLGVGLGVVGQLASDLDGRLYGDLVFRLCSAAGLLVVLPWPLSCAAAPAQCSAPGRCIAAR